MGIFNTVPDHDLKLLELHTFTHSYHDHSNFQSCAITFTVNSQCGEDTFIPPY